MCPGRGGAHCISTHDDDNKRSCRITSRATLKLATLLACCSSSSSLVASLLFRCARAHNSRTILPLKHNGHKYYEISTPSVAVGYTLWTLRSLVDLGPDSIVSASVVPSSSRVGTLARSLVVRFLSSAAAVKQFVLALVRRHHQAHLSPRLSRAAFGCTKAGGVISTPALGQGS